MSHTECKISEIGGKWRYTSIDSSSTSTTSDLEEQSTETITRNLPEDNDYVQQQPFGHNLELVENDHLPESHQRSDTQQPQASRYPRQTQVLPELWWNTDTSTRHTSEEKGSSVTQNCQCVQCVFVYHSMY